VLYFGTEDHIPVFVFTCAQYRAYGGKTSTTEANAIAMLKNDSIITVGRSDVCCLFCAAYTEAIVLIWSMQFPVGGTKFWALKVDKTGSMLWEKIFTPVDNTGVV